MPSLREHSYLRAIRTKSDWVNFMNAILVDLSTAGIDFKGHRVAQFVAELRYKPKIAGSIPDGVYEIFH